MEAKDSRGLILQLGQLFLSENVVSPTKPAMLNHIYVYIYIHIVYIYISYIYIYNLNIYALKYFKLGGPC